MRRLFAFATLALFASIAQPLWPTVAQAKDCAQETACTAGPYYCTCTGTRGGNPESATPTATTAQSCFEACERWLPGASYDFKCNDSCGDQRTFTYAVPDPEAPEAPQKADPVIPQLNVPIPGLSEKDLATAITIDPKTGDQQNTLLSVYINGVYRYLLGVAVLVAVVLIVIAGFQWVTSRGDRGAVTKARDRIENTIVGLVLLLGAVTIATVIDPRTTNLRVLTMPVVEREEFPPMGEDLDLVFRGDISTERAMLSSPYLTISASDPSMTPEAAAALAQAAQYLYQTYGEKIRVTSGSRTVEKQAQLFYNNCLANGGYCSPPTCNVAADNLVQKIGGKFRLVGELAGQSSASYIISKIASSANVASCPHTSGIAVDAWCQTGGNYTVDPECQLRVMEAMAQAGFCRLASEAWHFELNAYRLSSNCTMNNTTTTSIVTKGGTTYTPPKNCAKYDYRNHKCVAYRN